MALSQIWTLVLDNGHDGTPIYVEHMVHAIERTWTNFQKDLERMVTIKRMVTVNTVTIIGWNCMDGDFYDRP